MTRLSGKSLRSRHDDAPVNPMDSVSNLADAMLVLAVGIMLALIINWNVDISGAKTAQDASDAWDGTVDISWYDPAKTEYEIDTPAKLAGLAALVNGMADPTAKKIVGNTAYLVSKRSTTSYCSARAAASSAGSERHRTAL